MPVLELDNARISYFTRAGEINVVPSVSFKLEQGEALGLVGESGCGKSTVAFAVMNYLGGVGRLMGERILFEGRDMSKMSAEDLRKIRGGRMAMVYQDPMSSLNPVMPVGRQLMEVPIIHQAASESVEEGPIGEVFRDPRHPYTRGLLNCIPVLGSSKTSAALAPIPGQVPPTLNRPQGCIFASRCTYVEKPRCTAAPIATDYVPNSAKHRVKCLRSRELPPRERPKASIDALVAKGNKEEILNVDRLQKYYRQSPSIFGGGEVYDVKALNDINMTAKRGMTLAIVGESGCGKSTFAKVLTGIEQATGGKVLLEGDDIGQMSIEKRPDGLKRKLQMVFQNPDGTLNPSHSVGYIVERALRRLKGVAGKSARGEARRLMETVKLPADFVNRKPRQLSGGQKQRVAIARALAGGPDLVVADEPVSALDVSVQAAIINLLIELQANRDATMIFISHDLSVVRYLADRVAVMYLGKIVEFGNVDDVFQPPYHPYTEALLSAVPVPDPDLKQKRIILEGNLPSVRNVPAGCPFATRCPRKVGAICDTTPPPEHRTASGHRIACHIPLDELNRVEPVISRAAE